MKYMLALILVMVLFLSQAQTVGIGYQAVILDPKQIELPGQNLVGQPLSNGDVCVKFTFISMDKSIDYEEIQNTVTDQFGLVSLTIGNGNTLNGSVTVTNASKNKNFKAVKWDAKTKNLQVSISFDKCASFNIMSNQTLNYSPYALYAGAVDYENVVGSPSNLSHFKNDVGYLVPVDLDPVKLSIDSNQREFLKFSENTGVKFLVVNQSIVLLNQSIASLDSSDKVKTTKLATIDTDLKNHNVRILTNANSIVQTNSSLSQQIGGIQSQVNSTVNVINQLGGTYELLAKKTNASDLGNSTPSSDLYPSQLAVKIYVDQSIQEAVASGAPDATTLAKGKLRLTGDLGGTAELPTVPLLASKENLLNKSTSISSDAASDLKYPSVKAVKYYVDASVNGVALTANLDAKADKNSPIFTGVPSLPTGTIAVTQVTTDNSTNIATTAFVQNSMSAGVTDATVDLKGKLKLTGDLAGSADSPTVPKLAEKEILTNKSNNTSLGTSSTLYPSQNAVKVYVDARVASTAADFTEIHNEFSATAAQTSFTISHAKGSNRTIKMYINGIHISPTAFNDNNLIITYTSSNNGGYTLVVGDRIHFDYSY
jgi:hypothetical protein